VLFLTVLHYLLANQRSVLEVVIKDILPLPQVM